MEMLNYTVLLFVLLDQIFQSVFGRRVPFHLKIKR